MSEFDCSRSCTPESLASVSTGVPPTDFYSDNDDDELDESIEQSIAVDLETLTDAGSCVNRLELSLQQARQEYEEVKRESVDKLNQIRTKLKTAIEKTEPYVKIWRKAKELQDKAHIAALKYERSHSEYESAKETLRIAEKSIKELEEEGDRNEHRTSSGFLIDEAWQETLANATQRVEKASQNRIDSEKEHHRITLEFQRVQNECHTLEVNLKRYIRKSKPFYEERYKCNQRLIGIKKRMQILQQKIGEQKEVYKQTMKHLESLSVLMHDERGRKRSSSCLCVVTSEPDLLGTRSKTPDYPLENGLQNIQRMAITPDFRRKKDIPFNNIRAITFTGSSGSLPLVSTSTVAATKSAQIQNGSDIKEIVTNCLTRALAVNNTSQVESAKEIVKISLARAIEQYEKELDNHSNIDEPQHLSTSIH